MKRIIYLIAILPFFMCCSQNKKSQLKSSDLVLHREGKKFVFRTFADSSKVEHVKVYSEDGNLNLKYRLYDELKNGLEYGYYDSGNLKYVAKYVNDTLQGQSKWFQDTTKKRLKYIYNYIDGIVAGNQISFNDNGLKNKYFSNTYDNEIIYSAHYDDDDGNLINEEGFYKTFGEFNVKDIKEGKPINYSGFFSTPNHILIEYEYSISKIDNEKKWKKKKIIDSKIEIDTTLLFGNYIFLEKIKIFNKNTGLTNTEEYEFNFKVEKNDNDR